MDNSQKAWPPETKEIYQCISAILVLNRLNYRNNDDDNDDDDDDLMELKIYVLQNYY